MIVRHYFLGIVTLVACYSSGSGDAILEKQNDTTRSTPDESLQRNQPTNITRQEGIGQSRKISFKKENMTLDELIRLLSNPIDIPETNVRIILFKMFDPISKMALNFGQPEQLKRFKRIHGRPKRSVDLSWEDIDDKHLRSFRYGFPTGTTVNSLMPSSVVPHLYPVTYQQLYGKHYSESDGSYTEMYNLLISNQQHLLELEHKIKTHPPVFNRDQLAVGFIFYICQKLRGQSHLCPHPCARLPCAEVKNTASEMCSHMRYGLFKNDYRCFCKDAYIWDESSLVCERYNMCEDPVKYPCQRNNTERCELSPGGFKCVCKEEYMGPACEELRNACIERYERKHPGGDTACGKNGACTPVLGSDVYGCSCKQGFTDNPDNAWPDCQVTAEICRPYFCINGYCQPSHDHTSAKCKCSYRFGGEQCSHILPHWNAWSPWGDCDPVCGYSRTKHRSRECSAPSGCEGNAVESNRCESTICRVDGQWLEWTLWSACDSPCGGGDQIRTRECIYNTQYGESGWGSPCPGSSTEVQRCNIEPCHSSLDLHHLSGPDPASIIDLQQHRVNVNHHGWKSWTAWTACSTDCGSEEQSRYRVCVKGPGACQGLPYDSKPCYTPCPVGIYPYEPWSGWSRCDYISPTCSRTRRCPMGIGMCLGASDQLAQCVEGLCDGEDSLTPFTAQAYLGKEYAAAMAGHRTDTGVENGKYLQSMLMTDYELTAEENHRTSQYRKKRETTKDEENGKFHREGDDLLMDDSASLLEDNPEGVIIPKPSELTAENSLEGKPKVSKTDEGIVAGAVIAILIVAGVGIGAYFKLKQSKNKDEENDKNHSEEMDQMAPQSTDIEQTNEASTPLLSQGGLHGSHTSSRISNASNGVGRTSNASVGSGRLSNASLADKRSHLSNQSSNASVGSGRLSNASLMDKRSHLSNQSNVIGEPNSCLSANLDQITPQRRSLQNSIGSDSSGGMSYQPSWLSDASVHSQNYPPSNYSQEQNAYSLQQTPISSRKTSRSSFGSQGRSPQFGYSRSSINYSQGSMYSQQSSRPSLSDRVSPYSAHSLKSDESDDLRTVTNNMANVFKAIQARRHPSTSTSNLS